MVSVRRGFFFLLVLGQAELFYFGLPWATTQSTDFGYLLELLHVGAIRTSATIRTSTYNLKGYNVRWFKWSIFACFKLNRFALLLLCVT